MNVVPRLREPRGWRGCRLLLLLLGFGSAAAADEEQRRAEEARERMAPIVGRLLGAPFAEPVPVTVIDEEAYASKYKLTPPERARYEALQRLWVRLGLVFDHATPDQVKPPRVSGFYVLEEKRIYLLTDDPTTGWPPRSYQVQYTVAHELAHAHRHAAGLYDKWPNTWSEAEQAFRCLAEGDAQLWASAAWIEDRGRKKGAAEAAERRALEYARTRRLPAPSREWYAPVALVHETYVQGARFAARVHAHGGRDAIDAALRAPPTTTEQILHPEKYLGPDKDEPVRFGEAEVGSVLGTEWTHALAGTLGELFLGVFFSRALDEERGRCVAEGWDGCRFQLYTREGRAPLLVLMTAWDTEHDAAVFAGAWCDWAGRRDKRSYDVHTKPGPAGAMRSVRTRAGLVVTARRGREVMVVDGVVSENRVDILRALWRASRPSAAPGR